MPGQGAPYRAGQETQEEQQVNQQMVMMVQLLRGWMKVDAGGRNDRRTGGFSQPHLSPHMTCDSVMTSQRDTPTVSPTDDLHHGRREEANSVHPSLRVVNVSFPPAVHVLLQDLRTHR